MRNLLEITYATTAEIFKTIVVHLIVGEGVRRMSTTSLERLLLNSNSLYAKLLGGQDSVCKKCGVLKPSICSKPSPSGDAGQVVEDVPMPIYESYPHNAKPCLNIEAHMKQRTNSGRQ